MDTRSRVIAATATARIETIWAVTLGIAAAGVAITMRLLMRVEVGGEQAIFSYPAIVLATLLFGVRAGAVSASICFVVLWYYVIEPRHSFHLASTAAAITLGVYVVVGASLIWAIGSLRKMVALHRELNVQLEKLVEQRTAEWNRVWERSRELVVIVDEEDRIPAANPAMCQMMDVDETALRRRTFESMLQDTDRHIYRDARNSAESIFDARLNGAKGVAWVTWSMTHEAGRYYLVGRDFTTEHECGEMLQQSQKMELVGQLAGGLAHDFGNLLPPISMALHLLRKRHDDDDRTRDLIDAAEESVDRASHLITRLLDLSRPSKIEPMVRLVGPLLEEIAPLMRQVIGRRQLRLNVEPDLPTIRIDAKQLDMALLNLTLNARDATGDDGLLDIEVKRGGDDLIDIVLSDDGQGMDADTLARATEPFFSTKNSGEGTGLGLPMVHNFAIAAGGRFSIRSDVGEGTRATISLPIADDRSPALQPGG